jgi:hypothetical protein
MGIEHLDILKKRYQRYFSHAIYHRHGTMILSLFRLTTLSGIILGKAKTCF